MKQELISDGKYICNPKFDLTGQVFGELTVIKRAPDLISQTSGRRITAWLCKCSCGDETIVPQDNLRNGCTKHCKNRIHNISLNKYDLTGEYGIGYTNNIDSTNPEEKINYFYFDLEDYDKIKNYHWAFDGHGYITSDIFEDNKKHILRLHRLVMNLNNENLFVDHIGHNKFDNRKKNLRIVTKSQNNMNKYVTSNSKSGFRGVYWDNDRNRWTASIKYNGKQKRIGRYLNIEDAIIARKKAEQDYFGEYSYENSINMVLTN